jgi:hypothetical protein
MAIDPRPSTESQAEVYAFAKQKVRTSLSYPLKRSLLDAALRSSSVYSTVWYVFYSGRQFGHTVLDANYSPNNIAIRHPARFK